MSIHARSMHLCIGINLLGLCQNIVISALHRIQTTGILIPVSSRTETLCMHFGAKVLILYRKEGQFFSNQSNNKTYIFLLNTYQRSIEIAVLVC